MKGKQSVGAAGAVSARLTQEEKIDWSGNLCIEQESELIQILEVVVCGGTRTKSKNPWTWSRLSGSECTWCQLWDQEHKYKCVDL